MRPDAVGGGAKCVGGEEAMGVERFADGREQRLIEAEEVRAPPARPPSFACDNGCSTC